MKQDTYMKQGDGSMYKKDRLLILFPGPQMSGNVRKCQ